MKINLSDMLNLNKDYEDSFVIDLSSLEHMERVDFIDKLYSDVAVFEEHVPNKEIKKIIKNYKILISGLIDKYAH